MDKDDVLAWLKKRGTKQVRDGMARYGIVTKLPVFGVSMGMMLSLSKQLKKQHDAARRHDVAADLWKSAWYEAQLLATLVDDPALVTNRQMDAWAASFDNWAICDTACFHLFDRTPLAWTKVRKWSTSRHEFVKRAAFALTASLALHNKTASEKQFLDLFPLIERAASDERNFVKKGVNWALRAIGERSAKLHIAAVNVARRLAESESASCRWAGKDALRQLASRAVQLRLARRAK
jgi:3-methyladenine DNA glycosylase AlkD